jgi:UDP-N-acetylmuramyl tripeptide synthase
VTFRTQPDEVLPLSQAAAAAAVPTPSASVPSRSSAASWSSPRTSAPTRRARRDALLGTWLGKLVRLATLWRRNGGHALPGRVVERYVPGYLAAMTGQIPGGVAVVTGTNGKTTTTKMVVELLRASGLTVVTNPTGSNLTRGIVSSFVRQADWLGRVKRDLGVFEVDEAYASRFVLDVRPRWVLALNVSRDQLDRFGEVDTVAELVGTAMRAASEGVVTNADDPRLLRLAQSLAGAGTRVDYFGVAPELARLFPRDDELVRVGGGRSVGYGPRPATSVELASFDDAGGTYRVDGHEYRTRLQVTGRHNLQNAAAALALVRHLVPAATDAGLVERLGMVQPAFGRGQTFVLDDGSELQLVLVKNPAGFRQALSSYVDGDPTTMIAINDGYPDGRDVSWLWDIDVSALDHRTVDLTSGTRAADMALRLGYSDIGVREVEPNLDHALRRLEERPGRKLVLANYTAMVHLHTALRRYAATPAKEAA